MPFRSYMERIEPVWTQIDMFVSADDFLKTYARVDQPAGVVYAAHLARTGFRWTQTGFRLVCWNAQTDNIDRASVEMVMSS
jgi:hypothetical protein